MMDLRKNNVHSRKQLEENWKKFYVNQSCIYVLRKPTINWKGHFYISNISPTGDQGFTKCGCKGTCDSNTCKCKKSNILSNSRRHAGSTACKYC